MVHSLDIFKLSRYIKYMSDTQGANQMTNTKLNKTIYDMSGRTGKFADDDFCTTEPDVYPQAETNDTYDTWESLPDKFKLAESGNKVYCCREGDLIVKPDGTVLTKYFTNGKPVFV